MNFKRMLRDYFRDDPAKAQEESANAKAAAMERIAKEAKALGVDITVVEPLSVAAKKNVVTIPDRLSAPGDDEWSIPMPGVDVFDDLPDLNKRNRKPSN